MKVPALLLVSLLATAAIPAGIMAAAHEQNAGPENIKFKMGDLYLNFKHWKHQKWSNDDCSQCHPNKEWKIKNWDKEIAHQICISCHDLKKKGPVACKECHDSSRLSHMLPE